MFGIVGFEDLCIHCIIGINPSERLCEQDMLLSIQYESDFAKIAATDDLTYVVDYMDLSKFCREYIIEQKYNTLEALAYDLLEILSEKYQLHWIKIVLKKPIAMPYASYTFISLEKGKRKG